MDSALRMKDPATGSKQGPVKTERNVQDSVDELRDKRGMLPRQKKKKKGGGGGC